MYAIYTMYTPECYLLTISGVAILRGQMQGRIQEFGKGEADSSPSFPFHPLPPFLSSLPCPSHSPLSPPLSFPPLPSPSRAPPLSSSLRSRAP